jgi:hypothetical protein
MKGGKKGVRILKDRVKYGEEGMRNQQRGGRAEGTDWDEWRRRWSGYERSKERSKWEQRLRVGRRWEGREKVIEKGQGAGLKI